MPEKIDIPEAALKLDPAISILTTLGMWELAVKAGMLKQYILDTYDMEKELEKRADYIQTETSALAEVLHEIHGGNPHAGNDGGRGEDGG